MEHNTLAQTSELCGKPSLWKQGKIELIQVCIPSQLICILSREEQGFHVLSSFMGTAQPALISLNLFFCPLPIE